MNVILVGYGKMGKLIAETLSESPDMEVIGIVDVDQLRSFEEISGRADVVMDFSYPGNLQMTLGYVKQTGCALVLGTTGMTQPQIAAVHDAANGSPIMFSYNYSLGVAVLKKALAMVAPALRDSFDIEIVEAHHRQKADAPSGTAKLLKDAIDPSGEMTPVEGRSGIVGARTPREIGMHAIRGGSVAGDHTVCFLGDQETLEFKHSAQSRQIFVNGAVRAAKWVATQKPGLYTVDDMLWPGK